MNVKNLILIGLCLLLYGIGFKAGGLHYQNKLSQAQKASAESLAKIQQHYRQKEQHYQQISDDLAKQQNAYQLAQTQFTKRLNHELNRYAKNHATAPTMDNTDTNCSTLDASWVRLHDGAATGQLPENTPTSSKPTASTNAAIHTISHNYAQCRDTLEKLKAWQTWYQQISEAANEQAQ